MTQPSVTEEKPDSAPLAAAAVNEIEVDEHLDRAEGLRIAREALMREVAHYGGQAAIVLAIVGIVGAAGYWGMQNLPQVARAVAQPFVPPPPVAQPPASPVQRVVSSERPARVPQRKRFRRAKSMQIAAKTPRRPLYDGVSDPHGGRIIYQDGMITQYSWDR